MSAEAKLAAKLAEWGLALPAAAEPKGAYRPLTTVGDMIYASGHLPIDAAGKLAVGRLGDSMDVAAGYQAARLAGLCLLATLRKELGSLDRVGRVVKVWGAVCCTPDFTQQPAVLNGCSELFAEVFGRESGIAARSAVGVAALPLGAAVEVEAIFEV
ncbi:MAG: RidA family protein [Thermoguttaceae bacterium]